MSIQHDLLATVLQRHGYLTPGETLQVAILGGGVSNLVLQVTTPRQTLVIKQSLPKLRVEMDWYADQERIWRERDYLLLVGEWFPGCAPTVLFSDAAAYILAISEVTEAVLWKTTLMAGQCDPQTAARAGALLAQIHSRSSGDPGVAAQFARKEPRTADSFEQLRIDPYLRTVARRHADLAPVIEEVITQLEAHSLALVHGDYSPKNIFIRTQGPDAGQLVLLDAEVAHWGDPTFDVAFCLNHFLLKAIYHQGQGAPFVAGAHTFWRHYQTSAEPTALAHSVAERLGRQLAALFLARIDGKSPVEYLVGDQTKQALVRQIARALLARRPAPAVDLLFDAVQQVV